MFPELWTFAHMGQAVQELGEELSEGALCKKSLDLFSVVPKNWGLTVGAQEDIY